MVRCDACGVNFSRNDALTRHKKYSCNISRKTEAKRNYVENPDIRDSKSGILPHDNMSPKGIPTFDGGEFLGEKPKSDETISKIMEMLEVPQKSRAAVLREEKRLDEQKVLVKEPTAKKMKIIPPLSKKSSKQTPDEKTSPPVVKAAHLNTEEKKLVNKFSQLFREMKQTGKDNKGELCILLDRMRDIGLTDEIDYDKAYHAIICK